MASFGDGGKTILRNKLLGRRAADAAGTQAFPVRGHAHKSGTSPIFSTATLTVIPR